MSKLFMCDRCGKQFSQPLDEEHFKDASGELRTFDLCAPCRAVLKNDRLDVNRKYFNELLNKKEDK